MADIEAIDLAVTFDKDEEIHTEVSCKFSREIVGTVFESAGIRLDSWMTDSRDYYALALGAPVT